jgi:hypothetical protein
MMKFCVSRLTLSAKNKLGERVGEGGPAGAICACGAKPSVKISSSSKRKEEMTLIWKKVSHLSVNYASAEVYNLSLWPQLSVLSKFISSLCMRGQLENVCNHI